MISLEPERSAAWTSSLRAAGLPVLACRPWGDSHGYQYLLHNPGALAVLDLPGLAPQPDGALAQFVRAARLLAPVTVTVPADTDVVPLLEAGAQNVVRRDEPPRVLAARLLADARCAAAFQGPGPYPVRTSENRSRPDCPCAGTCACDGASGRLFFRSQDVLLELLCRTTRPVCCHDLRCLLGSATRPMSLPALRGRLDRLTPHLTSRRREFSRHHAWGMDTFTVRPNAAGPQADSLAAC
ncbi:hypothetical protein [Streptomyces sp. TLI_171]|uniref:hypothetical protein n=1 Tax=Streptomyces sp. TLI_171 TaxID=1938859 RepID=UPI000C180B10|nr:hypothetical protein [Streptomyces sp. TLI_171]